MKQTERSPEKKAKSQIDGDLGSQEENAIKLPGEKSAVTRGVFSHMVGRFKHINTSDGK